MITGLEPPLLLSLGATGSSERTIVLLRSVLGQANTQLRHRYVAEQECARSYRREHQYICYKRKDLDQGG